MLFSKRIKKEIKRRFKWKGYNFILCIPIILSEDNYDKLYNFLKNKYNDIYMFDRNTLHLSFSRFKITDFQLLEKYLHIVNEINNDITFINLLKENITINTHNNYIMGKNYLCMETLFNEGITSIISKYFSKYNIPFKIEIPHISVGINNKTIINDNKLVIKHKIKTQLSIILTEPLCKNDEDYYITLF